jgi:hypothetical protein
VSGSWSGLTEFRELWFPSPRLRLPELAPAGPVFIEGGRCVSAALGEYTKLWISAVGHGLIRLEDGRLHPITRDGGEDVFKSSWVTFSR